MWWWGPCAGASCCSDVLVPQRKRAAALYDELVPLMTDRRSTVETDAVDAATDDDSDADAPLLVQAGSSGLTIAPGIYRARDVRTHDAVALKVFNKAILKNQATRRRIRQEIHVLSRCNDHPNILRLYGVYSSRRTFEIAFELARGGEVMHRIVGSSAAALSDSVLVNSQPRYRVTEREISRVIASAASAIQYMHEQGIVHGEIRPEHLLYSDFEPDARVLLVDFGRAAAWRDFTFRSRIHRGKFLWQDRHSVKFLPPWVLRRRPLADGITSWEEARQVDVWSLGVTMFVLLCGAFPFTGSTLEEVRDQIVHKELVFPPQRLRRRRSDQDAEDVKLSRAARDLLCKLLEKDPLLAPGINEVCDHPWLSSDVAADVRWSDSQIEDFGQFAQCYARDVATSSLRQPTLGDPDTSSSSSRFFLGPEPLPHDIPASFDVYSVDNDGPSSANTMDGDFDADERPSFVSTDGNIQVSDAEERLSADAYMRLASAELEALAARRAAASLSPRYRPMEKPRKSRASPKSEANNQVEERPPEPSEIQGEFWPVFPKQRRLFSLKTFSFRSGSSGSRDE